MSEHHDTQTGIADAMSRLSDDMRLLVRTEIADARHELWDRTKALAPAAGTLALGAGLGVAAAASSYRLVLRVLEAATSPSVAALLATAGFGAGAGAALSAGARRLRAVPLPVPVATMADAARRAAEAVGDATREGAGG